MPSNATRTRIDWCPGDAAIQALEIGEQLFPTLNRQSVIDRLVITGLAAYCRQHWQPPAFLGTHRDRWSLPADIVPPERAPGFAATASAHSHCFPGMKPSAPVLQAYCTPKEPGND